MLKTIALYLPQFHQTPENDEWWGEGFTEWTAVKNAYPVYEGHNQPREPLNSNYYNLLDKSVMKWQVELAKKHMIDGFCFYHYWFENGRKLLEKPAENLLNWTDIDISFCFSWANESWVRSWSNVRGGNVWSELYGDNERKGNGILLNQAYGDINDWREHFEYLLPFFIDARYIKIDNKPVFIIYKPGLIPRYCLENMLNSFRNFAKESGLSGLYLIAADVDMAENDLFDAYFAPQPKLALAELKSSCLSDDKQTQNNGYSYDSAWHRILSNQFEKKTTYLCGVVDYDETPRRGESGIHLYGGSAEKFKYYFKELVKKSLKAGNELIFLNAWNEWGEGMYLEPDTKNGYAFLEGVAEVMQYAKSFSVEINDEKPQKKSNNLMEQKDKRIEKFVNYFDVLNTWLSIKQDGKSLESYFLGRGYYNIAIYGIGVMGKHLNEELKASNINVVYAVDKYISKSFITVYSLEDALPEVDAIVVTPTFDFPAIYAQLRNIISCPIISLEEIVSAVMNSPSF